MSTPDRNFFQMERLLEQINALIREINLHKDKKIKLSPDEIKEVVSRFRTLQSMVSRYKKFNEELYELHGIKQADLVEALRTLPKGSEAERIMQMSDKIKIDLLLSYADFVKKMHDEQRKSPFFSQNQNQNKESLKSALKKKYKSMQQRLKWKKM